MHVDQPGNFCKGLHHPKNNVWTEGEHKDDKDKVPCHRSFILV